MPRFRLTARRDAEDENRRAAAALSRRLRRQAPTSDLASEPVVVENAPDYASLKKDELVAHAEAKGLDTSGTKADLIARLNG